MRRFSATVFKLGINPCVDVPAPVLKVLRVESGKTAGPIPVRGTLNGAAFKQTVVKYHGVERLYINGIMLKTSKLSVGGVANVRIEYDPEPRAYPMNERLATALSKNAEAKAMFEGLAPSRQLEILRYLANLKSEATLMRNVEIVVQHLVGKGPKVLSPLFRKRV